jgi:hypothetical protein
VRWASLVTGVALIALAFAAASRVADTRPGLIAEIITLLAGATGIILATYGLAARRRGADGAPGRPASTTAQEPRTRAARDLVLGGGGLGLALILLTGLALSGGPLWASLGLLLLLPMVAGSVYLCWRFLRASS